MQDQVDGFSTRGIKCARVGSCTEEHVRQGIVDRDYQLVFISPETLLATRRWRRMLLSPQKSLTSFFCTRQIDCGKATEEDIKMYNLLNIHV